MTRHSRSVAITDLTGRDVPRGKYMRPRVVACPECGVEVDASCVNRFGAATKAHRSRVRLAVRALRNGEATA